MTEITDISGKPMSQKRAERFNEYKNNAVSKMQEILRECWGQYVVSDDIKKKELFDFYKKRYLKFRESVILQNIGLDLPFDWFDKSMSETEFNHTINEACTGPVSMEKLSTIGFITNVFSDGFQASCDQMEICKENDEFSVVLKLKTRQFSMKNVRNLLDGVGIDWPTITGTT